MSSCKPFSSLLLIITFYSSCSWNLGAFRLERKKVKERKWRRSVVSDSLRPHESQHARPPCPSPTPGGYPNSCPLSRRCHPTISPSVVPFSSCLRSYPVSGSFPMSQFFTSGGQSIGVSASASVLPMNIHGLISFRMDWLDLLAVQRNLKSFSNTTVQNTNLLK